MGFADIYMAVVTTASDSIAELHRYLWCYCVCCQRHWLFLVIVFAARDIVTVYVDIITVILSAATDGLTLTSLCLSCLMGETSWRFNAYISVVARDIVNAHITAVTVLSVAGEPYHVGSLAVLG